MITIGINVLRHQYTSLKRCEKCNKPKRFLYSVPIGDMIAMVCSGHCAEVARSNYQEKIDKGITPGSPPQIEDTPQADDDNIIDFS